VLDLSRQEFMTQVNEGILKQCGMDR